MRAKLADKWGCRHGLMRGGRRCYFGFMATEPDYYIVTLETDRRPFSWRWEIRRHSHPMGVKLGAGGYESQGAAEFAGKRALEEFLVELSKEERRHR
jgi:hypothetical protein